MATPSTRTPIRLARGTYSNLNNSIADLQEGEIVYATDQNNLYVKEGSSLILVTTGLLDEDNMATNSATQAASQQSIKAYVDASSGGSVADDSLAEVKLDISNAPSDGYFLQYKDSSDQLTWAVPTDTLPLTTEQVQDIVGAMFTGNTETNIAATYEDSDGTIDLVADNDNTQLTTEQVQDIVGAMFSGNTETNITVTYQDSDGTIDLASDNTQVAIDDTPVDGVTDEAISSNWAYDHNAATGNSAHVPAAGSSGEFLKHDGTWGTPTQRGIDDTPVDGETSESITSNWAYDHNAATGNSAHVPAAGSSGEFLAHNGAWATPVDTSKMPLAGGTFTGSVTFEDAINENVFAITDATSPVLEPNNGMIQTWTLNTGSISGARTPSDSIAAGQSMLLMVDDGDGSDAITWPSITWVGGSEPTLATSGWTVIELWKVASTLYASHVGDVA